MASTATGKPARSQKIVVGSAILMLAKIWLDRRWPGSLTAILVTYTYFTWVLVWFGSTVRSGILRRKPYWTRASWLKYLRLAAMPIAALFLFLADAYFFDPSSGAFGGPGSGVRIVYTFLGVALMLFSVVGVFMAINWMTDGEPSEQFTRTRWFRRRGASAIAD